MDTDTESSLMYDVPTAARLCGFGRTTAYGEIAAGRLRTVTVRRRRLVTRQALLEYIATLEQEAAASATAQ